MRAPTAPERPDAPQLRALLTSLGLLWLSGAALRMTVLAVPPLLPFIHRDLDLSETEIGALAGLPSLLFAAAAVPGSLIIARFGARPALIAGLIVNALAAAARGAATDVAILFAATIAMGGGIAVMQPALPPIVRGWLPDRIGFATAVYTNGLLIGEILAVSLTLPVVLPFAGGNWRVAIALWSLPVLLSALLVALLGPRPTAAQAVEAGRRRWWPDWRDARIWQLGFLFGGVNSIYFSANAFLPEYLAHGGGTPELIGSALTALNFGQLPASLLMLGLAGRLLGRPWAYGAAGLMSLASVFGMMLMTGAWVVFWAGMLGFADAVAFVLILALPPFLSAPDDAHRTAAGMFTVSYSCAVAIPIIGGLLWDASGIAPVAFVPIGLCAVVISVLPFGIDFRRRVTKNVP
ncbi:MAG TPA: MFS transporter [Xanthobacteraceae bacterium]|nr:MFS transporter [Xanthobacteraceae bacterium]